MSSRGEEKGGGLALHAHSLHDNSPPAPQAGTRRAVTLAKTLQSNSKKKKPQVFFCRQAEKWG